MALAAARPGIRATTFDALLIDNFNRANGALGTAYNGQAWTGGATINSGRFTNGSADIAMTGTVGNLAISVDCDPGSSALGDQAFVSVVFFKDPATSEKYLFEISQRNWFFIYYDSSGVQNVFLSGSPGYTYSTPFRLYVTAQYIGGVVYYSIETSNLTGGPHTVLARGSQWYQVTNGSHLQLLCSANQFFDNLRSTTATLPVVTLSNLGNSQSFSYDAGSANMLFHYTLATNGGSSSPQQWGLSHVRMTNGNFNVGYRYQWADSTSATDYMTREDGGQSVLSSLGVTGGLGIYKMSMNGNSLSLSKRPGSGGGGAAYSGTPADVNLDSNTYFGIATTNRSTATNITGMAL